MTIRFYLNILSILTALFLFRVSAQFMQLFFDFSWLPPFSVWQSGALPYPILVVLQLAILVLCIRIIFWLRIDPPKPETKRGRILLTVGFLYLILACIRIILGATIAQDHFWLNAPIPSVFHIVLASFILTYGHYHYRYSK